MTLGAPTREQTRMAWDGIAERFDRFATPRTISFGEQTLRNIDLQPGMRFLDVATGTGALSLPAARMGAAVVATDISPAMIDLLCARAREENLSNLVARVADGQDLDLEDDTFDVSASQNGVSLFPDRKRGLEELVRVTMPGGRVVVIAFNTPPNAEYIAFFLAAVRAAVPGFSGPPPDTLPPFRLADPEKMRQELAEAGLTDITVDIAPWLMDIQSAAHLLEIITSISPIGAGMMASLTEEQISNVRQVIDGMLRERSGGMPGAQLTNQMNVGIGTK